MIVKAKLFSSHKERALGLIPFKKAIPALFITRFGIHTFGLKFPIDVLVLDRKNRVVKVSENLKPGNVFFWSPKFNKVLELPAGFISKHSVKPGSVINLRSGKTFGKV